MNRLTTCVLVLVPAIVATSCRKPASPRDDGGSKAEKPVPAAGTGRLGERGDPVDALRKRTYFLLTDGALVHAGTSAGIVTWDVSDRTAPERKGSVVLPGSVSALEMLAGEARIIAAATGPTGLALVDAGQLTVLSQGEWASRGGCHAAWKARAAGEGRLLIACGTSGVAEADVTDPSSPRVTRVLSTGGYVRDLALLEGEPTRVALAAGREGVMIVAFPEAGEPSVVARIGTSGEARAIEVSGGHAYVANGAAGLAVVDLSSPSSPSLKTEFDPEATDMARGVCVEKQTLYLCMGDSGLLILDVSDPGAPRRLGAHDPGRALNRVAVDSTTLYAANDDAGLLVLDVSDPGAPVQVFPKTEN